MRCYRKILRITYKGHVTNEEVRAKIQQAIGPHEDLLSFGKRRKLKWSGHVSCSSGVAKTILQTTVKGGRRQGRQRRKWEDNIKECTGLEVRQVPKGSGEQRKLEGAGCEVVCGAHWPSQLRDKWRWNNEPVTNRRLVFQNVSFA